MFTSLRARLLTWYTAMLVLVVAAFGGLVFLAAWRGRMADVDAGLRQRAEEIAAALRPAGGGAFDLALPAAQTTNPSEAPAYHAVWDASGRLIDQSDPDLALAPPPGPGERTLGGRREVAVRSSAGPLVVAGRDLSDVRASLRSLAGALAAIAAGALLLSLAGGWMLVGRALEPVDRFGRTAQRMIDGDFTARIPLDGVETELKQAGRAINGAFERMYESLEMQRRFTADASHELRTPLATIAIETQTILARDRDAQAYRGALEVCRRAADRMRRVTERLLLLARADGGDVTLARVGVRLDLLVRRVLDDLSAIAAERRVTVAASTEPVSVEGDVDRLVEAVTSLVANAIEYNVPDGRVDLGVHRRGKRVEIRVTDTGIGIDAAHVPRIFDRFYRADPARARTRGGAGLGLAVAQSIIRQHGGQITCTSEPGRGSVFVVELPVA